MYPSERDQVHIDPKSPDAVHIPLTKAQKSMINEFIDGSREAFCAYDEPMVMKSKVVVSRSTAQYMVECLLNDPYCYCLDRECFDPYYRLSEDQVEAKRTAIRKRMKALAAKIQRCIK